MVFDEQAEDDSEDLKARLDDIRTEMEYPLGKIVPLLKLSFYFLSFKTKKTPMTKSIYLSCIVP